MPAAILTNGTQSREVSGTIRIADGMNVVELSNVDQYELVEMVEAAGVEPASEKTSNRELSCFSRVHLCLVSGA